MRYKPFTYFQGLVGATTENLILGQNNNEVLDLDYTGSVNDQFLVDSTVNRIGKFNSNSYVVGGAFQTIGGISRGCIAKIENGAVVTSAGWGGTGWAGPGSSVQNVLVQSTGKVIVIALAQAPGGSYNGVLRGTGTSIFRLNTDGTIDSTFLITSIANFSTQGVCVDNNDNFWITGIPNASGTSLRVNGVNYTKGIAKFNPDGNPITLISGSGFAPTNLTVGYMVAVEDKVVVQSRFTSYNTTSSLGIIKLNSDGSIDTSFNIGTGVSSSTNTVLQCKLKYLKKINKLAVAGTGTDNFRFYSGSAVNNFALINSDGTLDTSFSQPVSASFFQNIADPYYIDSDFAGNLYVSSVNNWNGVIYNDTSSQGFIKLDPTGNIIPFSSSSFNQVNPIGGVISTVLVL
jgi:hypothetical protein